MDLPKADLLGPRLFGVSWKRPSAPTEGILFKKTAFARGY